MAYQSLVRRECNYRYDTSITTPKEPMSSCYRFSLIAAGKYHGLRSGLVGLICSLSWSSTGLHPSWPLSGHFNHPSASPLPFASFHPLVDRAGTSIRRCGRPCLNELAIAFPFPPPGLSPNSGNAIQLSTVYIMRASRLPLLQLPASICIRCVPCPAYILSITPAIPCLTLSSSPASHCHTIRAPHP